MIKNVIFDIGNVLGHFCWEEVLKTKMGLSKEAFDAVAAATVKSKWWNEFDRSLVPDDEIMENCIKLNPAYEKEIRDFFGRVGEVVVDYDYSSDWIRELKAAGLKVYILSNYARTTFYRTREKGALKFLDIVDGRVISFEVFQLKPDPEIYETLLKKYALDPAECVFIDDRAENIETARKLGMKGIVFTDYETGRKELEGYLN